MCAIIEDVTPPIVVKGKHSGISKLTFEKILPSRPSSTTP